MILVNGQKEKLNLSNGAQAAIKMDKHFNPSCLKSYVGLVGNIGPVLITCSNAKFHWKCSNFITVHVIS